MLNFKIISKEFSDLLGNPSTISKLKIFLEVVRVFNRNKIIPVLYGSLGLYRAIDELERKVNDIDILLPDEFLTEKWNQLLNIMNDLNFVLKDKYEHEFIRDREIVAFGKVRDLVKLGKIDFEELKISEKDNAKFRELSPEQYLNCYKFMLRDTYRQEKRGNADKEKIALIEKYLKDNS